MNLSCHEFRSGPPRVSISPDTMSEATNGAGQCTAFTSEAPRATPARAMVRTIWASGPGHVAAATVVSSRLISIRDAGGASGGRPVIADPSEWPGFCDLAHSQKGCSVRVSSRIPLGDERYDAHSCCRKWPRNSHRPGARSTPPWKEEQGPSGSSGKSTHLL
jgi:hypothetical protein